MESSKHPAVLRFLAEMAKTQKENESLRATTTNDRPSIVIQTVETTSNEHQSNTNKRGNSCEDIATHSNDSNTRSPGIYRANGKWRVHLPPTPIRPSSKECCGSGCSPCIFDTFRDTRKQYKEQVERIHELHARIEEYTQRHHTKDDDTLIDIEDIITKDDTDVTIIKD